jgi:hypothetical protein
LLYILAERCKTNWGATYPLVYEEFKDDSLSRRGNIIGLDSAIRQLRKWGLARVIPSKEPSVMCILEPTDATLIFARAFSKLDQYLKNSNRDKINNWE